MKQIYLSLLAISMTMSVAAQTLPKRSPLLEEQTGLGCQYCPLGFAWMEAVAEKYPDAVIVSYHNTAQGPDAMAMKMGYPISYIFGEGSGNPWMSIDRTENFALGLTTNVLEKYEAAMQQDAIADIKLDPIWGDEEKNTITVRADVKFYENAKTKLPESGYFRIGYILVQNGMTDPTWKQANYYAGKTAYSSIPHMQQFVDGATYMSGLVYNDIAIGYSEGAGGIKDSLPRVAEVEIGKSYYNEYTLDLSACLNKNNRSLVQDKDNLVVVAYVAWSRTNSTSSGDIINSTKAKVTTGGTGVQTINANKEKMAETYYDLSGRKVTAPADGIYIRVNNYSDGTSAAEKIIICN